MYKKNDFSQFATRSGSLTSCGDTGEYGLIVWFGTKSRLSALKKSKLVMNSISKLTLKSFPKIKVHKVSKKGSKK